MTYIVAVFPCVSCGKEVCYNPAHSCNACRKQAAIDKCAKECVSYFWPKDKVDVRTRRLAQREITGIIRRFMGTWKMFWYGLACGLGAGAVVVVVFLWWFFKDMRFF